MKTRHRILTVLLTALLVILLPVSLIFGTSGSEPPFTGAALTYHNQLKEKGFPADYAVALTRLHLYKGAEHPHAAQKPEVWNLD